MKRSQTAMRLRSSTSIGRGALRPALLFAGVLTLSLGIQYAYATVLAPQFRYLQYDYTSPDPASYILGTLLIYAAGLLLPRHFTKASDFVLWVFYVLVGIPVATVPFYAPGVSTSTAVLLALVVSLIVAVLTVVLEHAPLGLLNVAHERSFLFWGLIGVISTLTYALALRTFGVSLQLVGLFDVYDTRSAYRAGLANAPSILAYLIFNQGNVINPLIMAWAAASKRWGWAVAATVGELALYSVTGYKTLVLVIPVALVLGAWVSRRTRSPASLGLLWLTTLVAFVALLVDRVRDLNLTELVVDRFILTAGYLTPIYLDVYQDRPYEFWSYSFLSSFSPYRYVQDPSRTIGATYFGRDDLNANANLVADGYANAGWLGVAIEAAVLLVLLVLLNSASRGLPSYLVMATLVLPAFAIANGSPFSSAFSFGFVLSIGLLFTLPRKYFTSREDTPALAVPRTLRG